MKKSGFIFLVLILPLLHLAAVNVDTYYLPFEKCFSVDLAAAYDGAGSGWVDGDGLSSSGYTDAEMVGLVGLTTGSSTTFLDAGVYTIKFSFVPLFGSEEANSWVYTSASDPTLQIPFGLDFIIKVGTWVYSWDDNSGWVGRNGELELDKKSLGYLNNKDTEPTDFSSIEVTVPQGNESWNSIWMDIVLRIPTGLKEYLASEGKISYAEADDYVAAFKVDFLKGESIVGSYTTYITGYYGSLYDSSSASVVFSINPLPSARSLNLTEHVNAAGTNRIKEEIGSYFYTTNSFRESWAGNWSKNPTSPFSLFASSSNDPTDSDVDTFNLVNVDNPSYEIPFEIGLKSDHDVNETINWYDGSGYAVSGYPGNSNNYVLAPGTNQDPTKGRVVYENLHPSYGAHSVTFDDEGTIYFRLGENVPDNLRAGYYSANVYFHLISNY